MPATTRSKSKQTRLGRDDDYTDDKADTTKGDLTRSRTGKEETPRDKEASRLKASGGGGASGDIKQPKKEPPVSSVTKRQRRQEQQQSRSGGRSPSPPPPAKRQKQQQQHNKKQKKISSSGDITSPSAPATAISKDSKPILINRAPVLQLWAACVTQSLYPDTTWSTCLGIGSQISTLCAISKGRRIGTIESGTAVDSNGKARKAQAQAQESAAGGKELEVMGFTLHVNRDGEVMVQGKPKKKANEGLLRGKFAHGEEDEEDEERQDGYERVKSAMNDALGSWKEKKEELNRRAFAMYERFRPSVQSGQRGWGRKGELKVEEIHEAVRYGA